jgi:anti-sigma regulatory factor (Ser/Thr protein kinase)
LLVATLTGERIPFEVELPSSPSVLPDLRRRLRAWLVRRELGRHEMDEVLLAVGEACNNAVEHAYRDDLGSISVRVDEDGETLCATVRDRGRWRDPTVSGDRGRGIEIMRALMDVADVRRTPTGTEVLLERRLHVRHAGVSPVGA